MSDAVSLSIESQIRALDVKIAMLERKRWLAVRCCDTLRAARQTQEILQLEFDRRALKLRWDLR